MASPVWTAPPRITLDAGEIHILDRGDWNEPGGGDVDRFCAVVFVEGLGWQQGAPPLREDPADAVRRPLYWEDPDSPPPIRPESNWAGRRVRVAVYAGHYFHGWGDEPHDWIEWGRENARDRNAPNISNTVLLGGPPSPPAPDVIRVRGLLDDAIELLEASLAVKLHYRRVTAALSLCRAARRSLGG